VKRVKDIGTERGRNMEPSKIIRHLLQEQLMMQQRIEKRKFITRINMIKGL